MAICRLTVLSKSVTTLLLDKIIEASFTTSQKVHWRSWKSEPEKNKHAIFFLLKLNNYHREKKDQFKENWGSRKKNIM